MKNVSRSNFTPPLLKTTSLIFAVLCAALWLGSCAGWQSSRSSVSSNANQGLPEQQAPTPTMTPSEQELVSGPFQVGEKNFASLQEFVQEIEPRCATEEPTASRLRTIRNALRNARTLGPRLPGSVEIPVQFHVLTNNDGSEGNVTDEVIQNQIQILNAAFAGQAAGGVGVATPFTFRLVGVDRTPNDAWFNVVYKKKPTDVEKALKAALNKGDAGTLNLYTAKLDDRTLGWARWPWDIGERADGVIIRYTTLPGGNTPLYNEGDTATHEIGHWLGLLHTFDGGCDEPNDEVADTSAEDAPAAGCPADRDTCPNAAGTDPVDNFMDYSIDSCMFRFTVGQVVRMDSTHQTYRE